MVIFQSHWHRAERLIYDGTTYIINGTGGGPLTEYSGGDETGGCSVFYNDETYGFHLVDVTKNEITIRFFDKDNPTGAALDSVVIRRKEEIKSKIKTIEF